MQSRRALHFDPSTDQVSVRRLGPISLATDSIRVQVDAVLLLRSGWLDMTMPGIPGGGFVGTVLESDAPLELPVGTRVVGISREGGCASQTVVPAATLFDLPSTIATEDAAIALVPGIRASCAVTSMLEAKPAEIVVVGATGLTGAFIGGLASAAGVVCHGIDTRPERPNDDADNGYAGVVAASQLDDAIDWSRVDAVIDCTRGTDVSAQVHRHTEQLPWFAFPVARGTGSFGFRPAGVQLVDAVAIASSDLDIAIEHFEAAAGVLTSGRVRLARSNLTFEEVPSHWPLHHPVAPGALILRPNGFGD